MLESLFIKFGSLILSKSDSSTGAFLKYWEIFKNTCFEKHLRTTASEFWIFRLQPVHLNARSCRGVLCKKVFLEISQNSQENTYARVSFLIKLQTWGLQLYSKRDSGTSVFLWILLHFQEHLFTASLMLGITIVKDDIKVLLKSISLESTLQIETFHSVRGLF